MPADVIDALECHKLQLIEDLTLFYDNSIFDFKVRFHQDIRTRGLEVVKGFLKGSFVADGRWDQLDVTPNKALDKQVKKLMRKKDSGFSVTNIRVLVSFLHDLGWLGD